MASTVIVLGAGVAGCGTALELADAGYQVILIEALDELLAGTSQRMPCRLGLGFHYADSKTALKNLHSTLAFVKKYPGFRLGEKYPDNHRLKRGRYFVVEHSQFSAEDVLRIYNDLKAAYTEACKADPSNQIFGEPENFFRILNPDEYSDINGSIVPILGIETAECILDWAKFKSFITQQIVEHPRIQVLLKTKVYNIKSETSSSLSKFSVGCQQEDSIISLEGSIVVNCTWHNIETLNATLGIKDPVGHRTLRLKAMAEIMLPSELLEIPSALFCFGPHAAFTNLGDGRGFVTYEPVTNVESSTEIALSTHMEELMSKNAGQQAERIQIGEAILSGAMQYLPNLAKASLLKVHFGIVRNFGVTDIYARDSSIHSRRESGVEQHAPGYIVNGSMKLTYFVLNAQEVLRLINAKEKAQSVFKQWSKKSSYNISQSQKKLSVPKSYKRNSESKLRAIA